METNEHLSRALLSGCPSLGPTRFRLLEGAFGTAEAILAAGPDGWRTVEGIGPHLANTFSKELASARKEWDADNQARVKAGVRLIIPSDPEYPDNVKSLDDHPYVLSMMGEWRPVDLLSVALVGSRHPTAYGRAATERLARELAEAGVTVVSGLARGVDSVAHETVVRRKGRTVGVIGSGFGRFYPEENRGLAAKMAERGAVFTEYAWSTGPIPINFPRRNRLISGMSLGVVVVEATVKSGALITARLAADQGRDVFAVPGPIFSPLSRGPHLLLKQGARPVEEAQDVLEALDVFRGMLEARRGTARAPAGPPEDLPPAEASLLDRLSLEPAGMDALSSASGLAPGALSALLLNLEMKGLIKAMPGKLFVRSESTLKG